MLHQLGGTPEVTPIEGVACIPTGDCRQEISKPDYQLACQGIGRPGQGFQDKCQIATLVGIEPNSNPSKASPKRFSKDKIRYDKIE